MLRMDYQESNFERLLRAIQHEEPDRVPYLEFWYVNQAVVEHVLKRKLEGPPIDFIENAIKAPDNVEFAQKIGMDAVPCDFIWRPNNVTMKTSDGTEWYITGTIKNWDDLERLDPPPSLEKVQEKAESYARETRGTNLGVVHTFTGVLDPTYLAMGKRDFVVKLYTDRDLIEHMMDNFLKYLLKAMKIVCEYDEIQMILINDDVAYGKGLFISPQLMKELWVPRVGKLVEIPKKKGKVLAYHSDGCLDQLLPILMDLGFSAVHPVEPYGNNIYELKKKYGDKICLMGNIDITPLRFGTPQDIEKDVKKHMDELKKGGGYVVSSSNSIVPQISPENFLAMTNAVVQHGRYR